MLKVMNDKNVAYLVGYLAGDGSFSNGWGKRKDRLSVTTTDWDVIKWFEENVIDFPITNPKLNNNEARGIFAKQESYVKTFPASWTDFLSKFGIMCKKKERTVCGIKKSNMKYFILGLLDADGCITWGKRKDRDRVVGKVLFTHQSEKILGHVQSFLMEELRIPSSIKPKTGEDCLMLSFSCLDDILKFCSYLYSDMIVLKRKWVKYDELRNEVEGRRSEGRSFPKEFMLSWDYRSLIGSMSKKMFIVNGKEYPSISIASAATGIDRDTLYRRCLQDNKGCSYRPKTETEIADQGKYVEKKTRALFEEWLKNN